MTTIIIITIISTLAIALIDVVVEMYKVHFIPAIAQKKEMERKAAITLVEEACNCLSCRKRELRAKEVEMVRDMIHNPNKFYTEITKNHGLDSVQMAWAYAQVTEINK